MRSKPKETGKQKGKKTVRLQTHEAPRACISYASYAAQLNQAGSKKKKKKKKGRNTTVGSVWVSQLSSFRSYPGSRD
jgi:hypothetical protein